MSCSFDWVCKDVVKRLKGKDLRPVKSRSDARKFCNFAILQKTPQSLFWKSEDTPVDYSLLQILEPNLPVPEAEVLDTIPLKHIVYQKVTAGAGVNAIVEGKVNTEYIQSYGYDIELQCIGIPNSKLEILQNRKLLEKEPSFVKDYRMGRYSLYVVTEVFEVTKCEMKESIISGSIAGGATIPQTDMGQTQGNWERKTTDSVPIQEGTVVAYKKKRLVIENDTCAILLFDNAKKKNFLGVLPRMLRGSAPSDKDEVFYCASTVIDWDINYISPIGECVFGGVVVEGNPGDAPVVNPSPVSGSCGMGKVMEGRIEEPYHQDFKHLQNEVSQITQELAMLSKDVQEIVFSNLQRMLSNRKNPNDLISMLEMDQLGHMDGPGGAILDQLRQDSIPPWIDFRNLLLYLLQALMVLNETQLSLLAQSMEKRLLLHQRELVKSILQPNFKYPWNIPFTLQPQLLAPLQDEGLTITYKLLKECGLEMELNNPRSTWDLEAKMPLSALYGSLSFLQQLVEA
ncbi:gasdermin-C-like [Arvicola amphibius]|uniref:gasdermin-C-like n=1 Tax=Arvicola amphibius TaxID=1047088 RepID=UPI001C092121|nr:gasdermin-C-like [Arvicola amphibius]